MFKASLLISPSTSNVQQGFSIINLICTSLHSSLSESNLDRFIRIWINGPEKLNDNMLKELIQDFKKSNDNRCLDLKVYNIFTCTFIFELNLLFTFGTYCLYFIVDIGLTNCLLPISSLFQIYFTKGKN